MPFRKRRFGHSKKGSRHSSRHGARRHSKHRGKTRVKDTSTFFPVTTVVTAQLKTEWCGTLTSSPTGVQGIVAFPLNGLYQPFHFCVNQGLPALDDCPANLYVEANEVKSNTPGTGLLGGTGSGAAYRQYKVLGAKVKIEFMSNNDTAMRFVGAPYWPVDQVTDPMPSAPPSLTSGSPYIDNLRYSFDMAIPTDTGQGKPAVFKRYYSMRKLAAQTKAQFAADRGAVGTDAGWDELAVAVDGVGTGKWWNGTTGGENPTSLIWFLGNILTMPNNSLGGGGTPDCFYRIHVKWYIQLFGRNDTFTSFIPALGPDTIEDKKEDDMEDGEIIASPVQANILTTLGSPTSEPRKGRGAGGAAPRLRPSVASPTLGAVSPMKKLKL